MPSSTDQPSDDEAKEIFSKIYDLLVEHAGAGIAGSSPKETFVRFFAEPYEIYPCTEWRFCGVLGFGGKFWRYDGRYFITCYPEDSTPKRGEVIAKVNELLKQFPYFESKKKITKS